MAFKSQMRINQINGVGRACTYIRSLAHVWRMLEVAYSCFQEFIFWTPKTRSCQDSLGFLFFLFCCCWEFLHRNVVLEGSWKFLFSAAFTGIFRRNSCGTEIPVFAQDSSGFLRIPPDSCSHQKLSGFVIGHGIGGKLIPTKWSISLRPDAGVSDYGLVCHHPTSQPHSAWWLWSPSTSMPRTAKISYRIPQ